MNFWYAAVDKSGRNRTGSIDATDERHALERLQRQGLTATKLRKSGSKVPWWQRELNLGKDAIDRKALFNFLFQLSHLLSAKMPVADAVKVLIAKTTDKYLVSTLQETLNLMDNGSNLTEALSRAAPDFPADVLAALRVGEQSNTLQQAVADSAQMLEARIKLRQGIISALTYPLVLLFMAGLVLTVVLFYLLPILEPIFQSQIAAGGRNPLGPLLIARAAFVYLASGIGVLSFCLMLAWPILRRRGILSLVLDRLPAIGKLRQESRSQFVATTLANILSSGGDINTGLTVITEIANSDTLRREMIQAQRAVQDGKSLSQALSCVTSLDPVVQQMAELGERAEEVGPLLKVAGNLMGELTQQRLARLVGLLVPALTALVGLVVGALVLITMNAVISVNDLAQ